MNKIFSIVLVLSVLVSCSNDSSKDEYMHLLVKLHNIECDHLKREGKPLKYKSIDAFRSEAFQAVLNNLDRKVLVEYEDCFQKLAQQEFLMSDKEKQVYLNDIESVYAEDCK